MSDCDILYGTLDRFQAGDLESTEAESLRDHVAGCAVCRRRLGVLARVDSRLKLLLRAETPPGVLLAARGALARETGRRPRPEVMNLEEVAEYLRVPLETVYGVADELPAFELGGHIRVRRDRLLDWVAERERAYARARAESEVARLLSRTT